jgi:hypothetical protein
MDLGEVGWGDVDWIGMAQDRNRWRAVVNSVLNLRVHKMLGNYRVPSRVVLSSTELVSVYVKHCPCMIEMLLIRFSKCSEVATC